MPSLSGLISVFEETRGWLALPDNDFVWSSWEDREDALDEIDQILSALRSGAPPEASELGVLFAPTGPIQEVSLSSGWGGQFLELAQRFDAAMTSDESQDDEGQRLSSQQSCECSADPVGRLTVVKELGLDRRLGEASVLVCRECGQHWLKYLYEVEAFTGSGRWYLGAITPEQLSTLTLEQAKDMLEQLDWYLYGGSYFDGRTGKSSGEIVLYP